VVNETGWEVHRSTTGSTGTYSLLVSTGPNVTSHSDGGLKSNTEYCYRVRSFKTSGKKTTFAGFTVATCATTFGIPSAASDVSATPQSYAVDIAWNSSGLMTDGFRLERAAGSEGPWVKVEVLGSTLRSYRDWYRPSEQQVCYRVIALNTYGDAASNVDCTTPPAAPSQLEASSTDDQSISLKWTDNSAAEDGFEVQRAGDDFAWGAIATVPANATVYVDRGVTTNSHYWYQVRATKDGGFSQSSNWASGAAASTPPDAPSLVSAQPAGSSVIYTYWETDSKLAEGYRAERSTDNGAHWTPVSPTTAGSNWFYDEGLPSEQQVCYHVIAFNRVGDSPASNMACTTPPAAPTNLVTVVIDDQTVEHQWRDNSGVEDGYELWLYGFDGWDYYYYPISLPLNTTSYQASSSEWVYGVAAVKDGGYSDWAFPEVAAATLQDRSKTGSRPPASAQRTPPLLKKTR
jgi:titin